MEAKQTRFKQMPGMIEIKPFLIVFRLYQTLSGGMSRIVTQCHSFSGAMSHNVTQKSCISVSFFRYFARELLAYLQIFKFKLIEMKRAMLFLVGVGLLLACSETNVHIEEFGY